ncbi:MAG: hypothetical protein KIT58_20525 [Planctomycetota bacterium]|nr:hypothetical protein [Planctomycetota bacterium]
MSASHYRLGLALLNVALVGAIGALGVRTFRGVPAPSAETPPADFSPVRYEIQSEGGQRSSVDEHRVTWQALDKPLPPVMPTQPVELAPSQPTPQDLSRNYTLVMASFNERDTALSSFIIQGRDGNQRTFSKGDSFDGYEVLDIRVQGDGEEREAIVTLESRSGARDTIRLRRRGPP